MPSPKTIPVKRSKAAVADCKRRAKAKLIPAEILIDDELDSLRDLRRRLCGYANSDSRCDCKFLHRLNSAPALDTIEPRGGERTGCCEVRRAIAAVELVKRGFELARKP